MAHLWLRDPDEGLAALPLSGAELRLDGRRPARLNGDDPSGAVVTIVGRPADGTDDLQWYLHHGPAARVAVNGVRLELGLQRLADGDEIVLDDARRYVFSTEAVPERVAMAAQPQPPVCGRCLQPVASGQMAVRCPGCGVWHHQVSRADAAGDDGEPPSKDVLCWTYHTTCSTCAQPTDLETGFRDVPEWL